MAKIREKQSELNDLEAAIDAAISEMPETFALRSFLISNKAEVKRMCITEYNEARVRAEDREEGRAEGREEGRDEVIINMLKDQLPIPTIMRYAVVSEETVRRIAQSVGIALA